MTDYSSVFFDFANLKRPMIFYMYDLDDYKNNLRDFYLDLDELPGPITKNEEELEEAADPSDLYFVIQQKEGAFSWDDIDALMNAVKDCSIHAVVGRSEQLVCDHSWMNTGMSVQGKSLMVCTKCRETKQTVC